MDTLLKKQVPVISIILLMLVVNLAIGYLITSDPYISVGIIFGLVVFGFLVHKVMAKDIFISTLLVVVFAILLPPVEITESFPKIRPEELIIYAVMPITLLSTKQIYPQGIKQLIRIFWGLFAIILASITYSYMIIGIEFTLRDFTELAQAIKYIVIIMFVASTDWTEERTKKFFNFFFFSLSIACIIGVLQYFNIGPVSLITRFYADEGHIDDLASTGRIFGTFGGPNQFSLAVFLGLSLTLSRLSTKLEVKGVLLLVLYSATIVLTGSRTALIASGLSLISFLVIYSVKTGRLMRPIVALSIVLMCFLFVMPYSSYLSDFYQIVFSPMSDSSFNARYTSGLEHALEYFKRSPVFGYGPAKAHIFGIQDSQYYYFLSRYGTVGIAWLLFYYFYPYKTGLKRSGGLKGKGYILALNSAIIITIPGFLIFNSTNVTFSTIQFMSVWLPILTIFFSSGAREEDDQT